jgi:hypothetical protein
MNKLKRQQKQSTVVESFSSDQRHSMFDCWRIQLQITTASRQDGATMPASLPMIGAN